MDDVVVGEIRIFAGPYAPINWHLCDGSLLTIADHEVLYMLIGTTYGGDGRTNFALPDLRGRLVVGQGSGAGLTPRPFAQAGGTETVSLAIGQLPAHRHGFQARNALVNSTDPADRMLGTVTPNGATTGLYIGGSTGSQANANANFLDYTGGATPGQTSGAPHGNVMASLVVNYIIALVGLYPDRG